MDTDVAGSESRDYGGVTFEDLLVEKQGPVLHVWLNRPSARNALTFKLLEDWHRLLDIAESDDDIHVVTLRGKGDVFSAGHDLKEVARGYIERAEGGTPTDWEKHRSRSLPRGWYFRKTLIAGVHGYVGPHAQRILSTFDFILAAEGTRFSFEQARRGSGDPGGNILAFQLPMRVIKQMWLLGGWMTAEAAKEMHFVQRVVPFDDLGAELVKWSESAADLSIEQIATYKEGIHRIYEIQGLANVLAIGNIDSGHGTTADGDFFRAVLSQGMRAALKLRQSDVDSTVTEIR